MAVVAGIAGVFLVFLIFYFAAGVRIVRPYQRGVIENLGRYKTTVDPGLQLIFPIFQKIRVVDMREQVADVPPQEVITKDNVVVSVDAVVYYEPTDPQRLIYNVANFILAITKLAQTNLRNLVGDMDLDSALTSRDQINLNLRNILDDATDKWGVRVGRVEIQRIDPPPDVMSAMHEQMKAERNRRAVVTQADGQRQAAIARAEGEKQAAILTAEGVKQQQILEAEGQASAIRAVAEAEQYREQVIAMGEADAIRSVYEAIHQGNPTNELIAIKYLEALTQVADGNATKIFLPAEMSGIMGSIGGIAELFNGDGSNGSGPNGGGGGGGGGGRTPSGGDGSGRAAAGQPEAQHATSGAPAGGAAPATPPPPPSQGRASNRRRSSGPAAAGARAASRNPDLQGLRDAAAQVAEQMAQAGQVSGR
ncbi:MAG: SPFH/Band 7/PHB domain protein [Acidimicrobiia bacterium]|nr:SPFH/Band 7/PHB domain protein [Acidimicrobiia bacterium]